MIKTTIVGIGDSTSSELNNSSDIFFINKLENFLPKYYPSIYWNIYGKKNTTLNSTSVNNILAKKVLPLNPNIVIVMIGSFDICKKNKDIDVTSLDDFEKEFKNMLKNLISFNNCTGQNNCTPIPLVITPYGFLEEKTFPTFSNNRLLQYNYIIKKLCSRYNVPIINSFDTIQNASNKNSLFENDGIHLNINGLNLLFDNVYQAFSRLINYEGLLKEYKFTNIEELKN